MGCESAKALTRMPRLATSRFRACHSLTDWFCKKKKDVGEVISTPAGPTADELWGNAYFSVPSRHGAATMIGGRQTLVRDDTFGSDV